MKKSRDGDVGPEGGEQGLEEGVPLSVREARQARERRDELWPYIWMNIASMVFLFAAALVMAYRMGQHRCLGQ